MQRLRDSGQYDEFTEAETAATADGADTAYRNFVAVIGEGEEGEPVAEAPFGNKTALWNQIASAVRDDLLLAGKEHTGPLLDADSLTPAVGTSATQQATGGRGQVVFFLAAHKSDDGPVIRVHTYLIRVDGPQQTGTVTATMPAYSLPAAGFETVSQLRSEVDNRGVGWAKEQPAPEQTAAS